MTVTYCRIGQRKKRYQLAQRHFVLQTGQQKKGVLAQKSNDFGNLTLYLPAFKILRSLSRLPAPPALQSQIELHCAITRKFFFCSVERSFCFKASNMKALLMFFTVRPIFLIMRCCCVFVNSLARARVSLKSCVHETSKARSEKKRKKALCPHTH